MSMSRKLPPPETPDLDDAALFRSAIGEVREIAPRPAPPARPRPAPKAAMAERDERAAAVEFRLALDEQLLGAGDALVYRRDEVPPRTLKRLARGEFAAVDELDLHGIDSRSAENWLREFLRHAVQEGFGCVRIIHGKGRYSAEGVPVLKNLVDRMLRQRADVLAFHSAPAAQGGTGAVLVLLASRRRR
ncbi:SMR domain protein [Lysobacteraceae bacterium NML08-0793]|nr:SMR domain protein [Xanthomonadaceae bacterium NML08-0793]